MTLGELLNNRTELNSVARAVRNQTRKKLLLQRMSEQQQDGLRAWYFGGNAWNQRTVTDIPVDRVTQYARSILRINV